MIDKNKAADDRIVAVKVNDRLEQDFLHQLAIEEGLKAWIKPNSRTRVYFKATNEQVVTLLEKARPAFQILDYRRHEIVAEAMLYAGSQGSEWPQIISQTQAKVSLFVNKRNKQLGPVLKSVEKARAEIPPMMQFAAELFSVA